MKEKKIKPEYLPGGAKREEIRKKAIQYLQAPILETQAARHEFITKVLKFTETEYLEILNQATSGMVKDAAWN